MKRSSRRALLLALALDALGEPPDHLHPVVWMGHYLKWAQKNWRGQTPEPQLAEGAASWLLGAALAAGAGQMASGLPWYAQGALLKPLLARRALLDAAQQVGSALERGDLPEARRLLGWHLVSRDTSELSAAEVAGAAIESLAENLSDSVIAPLLAYRLGGLPLAAVYRLTNTADALWGYRTPELEYAGKAAAKADDLLNLAPARLTALCALAAAGGRGWPVWVRDHRNTPSPNAGHPMSAFAGALGVRLDKRGPEECGADQFGPAQRPLYVLNASGREPTAADLGQAARLADRTVIVAALLLCAGGSKLHRHGKTGSLSSAGSAGGTGERTTRAGH